MAAANHSDLFLLHSYLEAHMASGSQPGPHWRSAGMVLKSRRRARERRAVATQPAGQVTVSG